ncbi:MAG: phosphate ABC transporter permease PstA [Candidatus Helarchaeota archaeon]
MVPPDKFKWFAYAVVTAATAFILIFLGIIIFYIVINGVEALSWEFITGWPSGGGTEGGILPAILGSLFLIGGAILYAAPIGVLAGIYLAEYAKEGKIKRIIETGIDNLNATPSIIFGLFGYAFLVIFLFGGQRCLLAGQLTLALMILPTIIRTTVEAIRAVPQNFREGSLALGATKWETTKRVVLAPAAPGILTGVVLGIGRAAGETAPIMFTAAVFVTSSLPTNPMNPVMALPYHLYYLSTVGSGPEAAINAGGTALVLLIMVLFFYSIAMYARARFRKKKKW